MSTPTMTPSSAVARSGATHLLFPGTVQGLVRGETGSNVDVRAGTGRSIPAPWEGTMSLAAADTASNAVLVTAALLGIASVVVLITVLKVHPFLALILGSAVL